MSCSSAISSQILTFILVPHEILLLRHKVFQEYAKVAFSPDFSHTFPSLILVTAVYVALQKSLTLNWLKIPTNITFLTKFIQILVSWIIINAALWHWLIIQRVLYCVVWTHWRSDVEILEMYSPWWRRVFSSFYPSPKRPVLSASFVSWILSMVISGTTLLCIIYINHIISILRQTSESIKERFKTIKIYQMSSLKKLRELTPCFEMGEDIPTDKSEMGSSCDECRSDISADLVDRGTMVHRGISPISYGTNWIPPPTFKGKKS